MAESICFPGDAESSGSESEPESTEDEPSGMSSFKDFPASIVENYYLNMVSGKSTNIFFCKKNSILEINQSNQK